MSSEYSEISEHITIASCDEIISGLLSNKVRIIESAILDYITLLSSPYGSEQDEDQIMTITASLVPKLKEPNFIMYSSSALLITSFVYSDLARDICEATEPIYKQNIENDHLVESSLLPYVLMNEVAGRDIDILEDLEDILNDSEDEDLLLAAVKAISVYFCFQGEVAEWTRKNLFLFNKINDLPDNLHDLKMAALYFACLCSGDDKGLNRTLFDIMEPSLLAFNDFKLKKKYGEDVDAVTFKLEKNEDIQERVKIDGKLEVLNGVVNVILYRILSYETSDKMVGKSELLRDLLDLPKIKHREEKAKDAGARKYNENVRRAATKQKESKIRTSRFNKDSRLSL